MAIKIQSLPQEGQRSVKRLSAYLLGKTESGNGKIPLQLSRNGSHIRVSSLIAYILYEIKNFCHLLHCKTNDRNLRSLEVLKQRH